MASIGMGVGLNGSVMGMPMGFLDFAPEPPAPTATPVTEHIDLNCTPSHDTKDLSSNYYDSTPCDGSIRVKFETLRSLDPQVPHQIQHHQQQIIHTQPQAIHQTHVPIQQTQLQEQQQHTMMLIEQSAHPVTSSPLPVVTSNVHHITTASNDNCNDLKAKLKQEVISDNDNNMDIDRESSMQGMIVTPEISSMVNTKQTDIYQSDTSEDSKIGILDGSIYTNLTSPNPADPKTPTGPKTWTAEDMESALEALRTHNMSLTKASATYGIPSTTLWQRAHRLGIDTPKKEGPSKTWNEDSLNSALEALRTGTISANKASKAFGIPSSTLYKIARREGIRLAAPFNAAPTTWSAEDLDRALEAIRAGQTTVQKASTEFGIPTGTLYGRCKREGIELSRSNPTPWSEDAMMEALESVKQGHMSINQAAIHYNLPYSSLYGRFKRGKYDTPSTSNSNGSNIISNNQGMEFKIEPQQIEHSPENTQQFNPAFTSTITTSTTSNSQSHIQSQIPMHSPSPVNIHIINSNHHQGPLIENFSRTGPSPQQQHHLHQPQLLQHHIIHHQQPIIIHQQPIQQIQQQPHYHPQMYHVIKQEPERS